MGLSDEDSSECKTMRLEAKINGTPILVLIDSGASHNFVSPQVVSSLDLEVDQSKKLAVRLGDGHRVLTRGKCHKRKMLECRYKWKK